MNISWSSVMLLSPLVATSSAFSVPTLGDRQPPKQSTRLNVKARNYDIKRRDLILGSIALFGIDFKVPAADADILSPTTIRVSTWPDIVNLEPMYEFKLSIDALQEGVKEREKWPLVKKRLDKFFKGAILSEKNFYFGVGLQYMNDIKYAKDELPNYIVIDQQDRYDALERTMKNLDNLKNALVAEDAQAIEDYAKDSQIALASWFALVPDNDVRAVKDLYINVKKADVNRDGSISDEEFGSLSLEQQELWKKRADKFG
mmetsp:Transcript_14530/g.21429  ORF Transcript_14530/g.21429 Transcript_14530/m.21429 type:complete len:259 (+) Transcript_14530:131-907(+)